MLPCQGLTLATFGMHRTALAGGVRMPRFTSVNNTHGLKCVLGQLGAVACSCMGREEH